MIIRDSLTGKEYRGLVDDELIKVFNNVADENKRLKLTLEKKDELLKDVLKINENLQKRIWELEDGG